MIYIEVLEGVIVSLGNSCSTPFRSDPIGGSEPVLGCSFNYFYLIFIYYYFFKSVATRIPGPTRIADLNLSPIYFDRFHLSYQNILFMSFRFRVFNYAEAICKTPTLLNVIIVVIELI